MPDKKEDFVKWFSELNKSSGSIAGGKGANLAEIYNLKISVPQGFVVTAQAYNYFLEKAGINGKIKEILEGIKYEDTENLDEATSKVRELITDCKFPEEMKEEILEAYETLGSDEEVKNAVGVHDILKKNVNDEFVAVRSSATTEDLEGASFAGQQDTYLNVKGTKDLLENIKKCFASLFTPRATYYRNKKGFKHEEASLAVVIQKMVDSNKSGVIFSKDPSSGKENIIIEAVWGLGEGIVSGQITPDRYVIEKSEDSLEIKEKEVGKKKIAITRDSSGKKEVIKLKDEISERQVLKEHEIKKLAQIALKLEDHYKKPQDIEFAIENEDLFIVQTRPITTLKEDNIIKNSGEELKGEVVLKGLGASPGIASGKVKIIKDLKDLKKIVEGDIMVTIMTNPDMVVEMQKSAAIVTDEGGLTAHASIVSREMGIPAVVGTQEATIKLKEGEIITVDGFKGKVYKGKVSETIQKEVKPVLVETKTKLKVIIDLPSFATRAAKSNIKSVGLARVEGIIAESGKHPKYFLEKEAMEEYEKIIFRGISEIAEPFEEIWVRTSDIRSDEFKELEGAPKNPEANPMLGMHGIRYSLKHPTILKAELNAMKKVAEEGKTIGILTPQVISVEEIKKLKSIIKEIEFKEAKVGVMIETPAAVQIINELCEEGIDFISFGTNDLTQYTLAIDRGNQQVQDIYDETHPAVLNQIEQVIKVCKEKGVETSICGQAGSKKPMVKFLVEAGIDSISLNADVAEEISTYISELEGAQKVEPEKSPEPSEEVEEESNSEDKKLEEEYMKEPIPEPSGETKEERDNELEISEKKEEETNMGESNPSENGEEVKEETVEKEPEKFTVPYKETENQEETRSPENNENTHKEYPEENTLEGTKEETPEINGAEPKENTNTEEDKSESDEVLDIF